MYDQRPLKTKMSISIDSDVERALKELSQRDDRSVSQYINRVLKQHLEAIGYFNEQTSVKDDE